MAVSRVLPPGAHSAACPGLLTESQPRWFHREGVKPPLHPPPWLWSFLLTWHPSTATHIAEKLSFLASVYSSLSWGCSSEYLGSSRKHLSVCLPHSQSAPGTWEKAPPQTASQRKSAQEKRYSQAPACQVLGSQSGNTLLRAKLPMTRGPYYCFLHCSLLNAKWPHLLVCCLLPISAPTL